MATPLHNLPRQKNKLPKKRVGRGIGSGKGTYSTRGIKGQRARSGGRKQLKKRSMMRQFLKKTPKLGGFNPVYPKAATITLQTLNKHFLDGDTVTIAALREKKLLKRGITRAKIVSTGHITKKLTVRGIPATKQAADQITQKGGAIVSAQ